MLRRTDDVIQELLNEMTSTVRSYHPSVGRTGPNVGALIRGTAFFPGGAGVWRGHDYWGMLPKYFPAAPVLILGHNFDSVKAHAKAQQRGGEVHSLFWKVLLGYLATARLVPEQCFFTNALMGLKSGSALGGMPTVPGYLDECRAFLVRQIDIVAPRAIITLGGHAERFARGAQPDIPRTAAMHPSARELKPLNAREQRIEDQGMKVQVFLSTLAAEL